MLTVFRDHLITLRWSEAGTGPLVRPSVRVSSNRHRMNARRLPPANVPNAVRSLRRFHARRSSLDTTFSAAASGYNTHDSEVSVCLSPTAEFFGGRVLCFVCRSLSRAVLLTARLYSVLSVSGNGNSIIPSKLDRLHQSTLTSWRRQLFAFCKFSSQTRKQLRCSPI